MQPGCTPPQHNANLRKELVEAGGQPVSLTSSIKFSTPWTNMSPGAQLTTAVPRQPARDGSNPLVRRAELGDMETDSAEAGGDAAAPGDPAPRSLGWPDPRAGYLGGGATKKRNSIGDYGHRKKSKPQGGQATKPTVDAREAIGTAAAAKQTGAKKARPQAAATPGGDATAMGGPFPAPKHPVRGGRNVNQAVRLRPARALCRASATVERQ